MLVLARRKGESLMIGEDIEITVVDIQGDKVRIGITAPRSLSVLRKELIAEVSSSNAEAVQAQVNLSALAKAVGRS